MTVSQKMIYESLATLRMEVEALEIVLDSHRKELAILIRREGPGTVRSVVYDGVPGVRLIKPQDEYVNEIADLNAKIENDRKRLDEKKKDLAAIMKRLSGWEKQLNSLELKVFRLQFTGEKPLTNIETAQRLGYSIGYVKNIKMKIYGKLTEVM